MGERKASNFFGGEGPGINAAKIIYEFLSGSVLTMQVPKFDTDGPHGIIPFFETLNAV